MNFTKVSRVVKLGPDFLETSISGQFFKNTMKKLKNRKINKFFL